LVTSPQVFPAVRAVFHCFTGDVGEAKKVLDAGYLLRFTGVITFKNSGELREVVKLTPWDRLVWKPMRPYSRPSPCESKRVNESALVMYHGRDGRRRLKGGFNCGS